MAEEKKKENLETLSAMWAVDAEINELELGKAAITTAKLHSKWRTMLYRQHLLAKSKETDYLKLKKKKWRYYSGKMSKEELATEGWEPFPYILKDDIGMYIEGDEALIELGLKKFYHDEMVDFCKSVLKELGQRVWACRCAVDFLRYTSGG